MLHTGFQWREWTQDLHQQDGRARRLRHKWTYTLVSRQDQGGWNFSFKAWGKFRNELAQKYPGSFHSFDSMSSLAMEGGDVWQHHFLQWIHQVSLFVLSCGGIRILLTWSNCFDFRNTASIKKSESSRVTLRQKETLNSKISRKPSKGNNPNW